MKTKKTNLRVAIVFLFICGLILCGCLAYSCKKILNFPKLIPVEKNIENSDVVGIWHAVYDGERYDTLKIFSDGTYQQIYFESLPSYYNFTSERNNWYLDESSEGMVYLHLEEGKYFLAGKNYLENHGWGNSSLYDPFSKNLIQWEDDLILVIVSDESNNLFLHNLWVSSDGGFPVFKKDIEYFKREYFP